MPSGTSGPAKRLGKSPAATIRLGGVTRGGSHIPFTFAAVPSCRPSPALGEDCDSSSREPEAAVGGRGLRRGSDRLGRGDSGEGLAAGRRPGVVNHVRTFGAADIAPQVASVEPEARRLMDAWWRDLGATADDAEFARWIAGAFPAPPSQTERTRDAHDLESLASARPSQGVADAKWLDDHGNDDVWTSLASGLPASSTGQLDELLGPVVTDRTRQ